jgi:hypothetical protein
MYIDSVQALSSGHSPVIFVMDLNHMKLRYQGWIHLH